MIVLRSDAHGVGGSLPLRSAPPYEDKPREELTMFPVIAFILTILGFFGLTLPDISALSGLFG